jgi:predicted nucleotidyltransferase
MQKKDGVFMRDMLIARLSDLLASFDDIEFAYLFGSYVDGNISKHSDIDIAIYIKDSLDSFEVGLAVHHKLEIALSSKIDVVVLNDVKNYRLLKDIIYKGRVLKDSENRPMFEVQKQHEIIDFFDFKRMIDAA